MSKCQYEINMDLPPPLFNIVKKTALSAERDIPNYVPFHDKITYICPFPVSRAFTVFYLVHRDILKWPTARWGKWNKEHRMWQIKSAFCSFQPSSVHWLSFFGVCSSSRNGNFATRRNTRYQPSLPYTDLIPPSTNQYPVLNQCHQVLFFPTSTVRVSKF